MFWQLTSMGAVMDPQTFTLTFDGVARVLDADAAPLTAAAVLDLAAGEYRWESDPCILTMDVQLSAWQGKVVFEAGGFGHRALPLTFQAALVSGGGHDNASPVGRIEDMAAEGLRVRAGGWVTVLDGDDDPGRQYALALANGNMTGVSVDVAVLRSTDAYVLDNTGMPVDMVTNAHEWSIGGLTAVNMGADPDARVRLTDMPSDVEAPEPEEAMTFASGVSAGIQEAIPALKASVAGLVEHAEAVARAEQTPDGHVSALTAAAAVKPDPSWFDNPRLDRVTPLQVSDDGRVFGHIAPWSQPGRKECHVGFADRCVCAPKSPDGEYPYFLTGEVLCADGTRRRCGRLALYGGHHRDDTAPWTQVAAMYDDVRNLGALVNVGEDAHGLWAAGMVAPGSTDADIARLRGAGPSGHWQRVQGDTHRAQRLIAACAVMSQGFPISSLAASAGGLEVAAVEGPTATYDDDGLVSLTAATGTAALALAKEPVDRGTVDLLAGRLAEVETLCASQGDLLRVLGPAIREHARAALTD